MPTKSQHPETLVLHAGYRSDPATTAVAVPIYQTTSYQFRDSKHAADLFGLAELGNIYTRIMNPTNAVLEERVAALEGGVAALALASGQAASLFAVQNICQAGDNFVSSTDLYGGTWNLFLNTMMKTMGMEVRFVDPADPENFRRATDARTRCYYAETLPNPKLEVFPISEVAKIGRQAGRAADRRQHRRPGAVPAARPRRRRRHAFDDEIHRRPRHLDRRHRRRWRQFRLGAARRPLSAVEPAGPELSRRGLDPGGQAVGADRLYPEDAGDPVARSRRADEPVQRLYVHPGAGDPAVADARPLRQCGERRQVPRPSTPKSPA